VTEEGLEEDATGSDDEVSPWHKMAKENAKRLLARTADMADKGLHGDNEMLEAIDDK
jgi:hypothetical protein